jgi:Zn-dependent protease with chaperone function
MNNNFYLTEQKLNEQRELNEITGLEWVATIFVIKFIIFCIQLFAASSALAMKSRIEPKLTEKFKKIDGSRINWKVRVINYKNMINAFTFGGSNLYITQELLNLIDEDEVMAIMLHEAGHSKQLHVWQQELVRSSGAAAILLLMINLTAFTGGAFFLAVFFSFQFYCMFIVNGWSRMNEWQADSYAVDKGYGKPLSSALTKLAKAHKINMMKCSSTMCKITRGMENMTSTHPDIRKRIEHAAKSPEGKRILATEKDPATAMLKIAKLAGVTSEQADKAYDDTSKMSLFSKTKEFLKKDIRTIFGGSKKLNTV